MTEAVAVLVVDDEPPIRRFLRTSLFAQGFRILEAETGAEALERLQGNPPDVVLLDLGLPDADGLDIIRSVRSHSTVPIIVLSSRSNEQAKVSALNLGADDYVTKPFGMEELIARIRTALRHRFQQQGASSVYRNGILSVDLVRRTVRVRGEEVKLSRKEYLILSLLVAHAGKVLTHQFIMRQVWETPSDVQYLRVYIKQLRQKIEPEPQDPRYILTETGVGYRLSEAD
ncbi:MAG: response regulator transcription factor [Defluviicoccus sp.]|nr:response regulator transcription factor [Defluviicoccus sp.]MDG4592408.1 response regulator transcription factor [Defluviicoccus sp.]MDS4010873.1 response regulator transcription factor [Defluviicoccus sp.]MDS4073792.1 response regulator transcription factor [Defluviicoccus sp.]